MNSEIKKNIDKYIEEFLKQDFVKQFFLLKNIIDHSQEIKDLRKNFKSAQKKLALSIGDKNQHDRCLDEYLRLKEELDTNPILCNFEIVKEQILDCFLKLQKELKN